jgi:gas vesicle protein
LTESEEFMTDSESLESQPVPPAGDRGGFIALAIVAAAVGAGAALLLAPDRLRSRKSERRLRREQRTIAAAGFLVGAGLTALLAPESGPATRKKLSGTWSRIRVGAIDHIERLRLSKVSTPAEESPVRSVQELGKDPNNVF